MPCSSACKDQTSPGAQGAVATCNGALKAQIGICQYPTGCPGAYQPVGHYVKIGEFPTRGLGEYVYAYEAMNCGDGISEVGILGAEQCVLRRGIGITIKQQPDSCMLYGRVATALGTVEGTEVKIGYTDPTGKFWTMWSEGVDGAATGFGTGEFDLNGLQYTSCIAAAPLKMPESGVYGSVIGSLNDVGTSVGILGATLPSGIVGIYKKFGVYGAPCSSPTDTSEAYGGLFSVRDASGAPVEGATAVLGMKVGTIVRAASFEGRIALGALGRITRDAAQVGEIYLDGENLKVRLS